MDNKQIKACLSKITSGDKKAFEELYQDLSIPIYTIVFRLTKNKESSEDILHDLFIKLYQSPPGSSVKNPRAYIFQMAHNLALNNIRKVPPAGLNENHIIFDDAFSGSVALQADIAIILKKLTHDELEIVSFRINGDLKFKEISEILQIPLGTILWKYQKAIGKLRIYLNDGLYER